MLIIIVTVGEIISRVIDGIKPESVYFSKQDGHRGAIMVVEVPDASAIPSIAEPWFLNFEANCEFRIAMTPDDLMRANLTKLAEKWSDFVLRDLNENKMEPPYVK